MMKCIVSFYDMARKVIIESPSDAKVSWSLVHTKLKDEFDQLSRLKFLVNFLRFSASF
jgi:hypothetical protein